MDPGSFDSISLGRLRKRRSAKWRMFPDDVLPAFVAEADFDLAPPIATAVRAALDLGDTGYASRTGLPEAFAQFASERFSWRVEPDRVLLAPDVMTAVAELLRVLTKPGAGVVINPPVYPPFFHSVERADRSLVEVPLAAAGGTLRIDLEALEAAFVAGSRAMLLCSPHNPTGRVLSRDDLTAIAEMAVRHRVLVICDEIHAPLTLPGSSHTPFLALDPALTENAVLVTSASKAFNIPGLKCAVAVCGSDRLREALATTATELLGRTGHLGVIASDAAFRDGGDWLDSLLMHLDRNRTRLRQLLAEQIPEIEYADPQATYLAWLDCRALDLGDDPADAFEEAGRVALAHGPLFGVQGKGFVRLNFGTSGAILEDIVARMAKTVRAR